MLSCSASLDDKVEFVSSLAAAKHDGYFEFLIAQLHVWQFLEKKEKNLCQSLRPMKKMSSFQVESAE